MGFSTARLTILVGILWNLGFELVHHFYSEANLVVNPFGLLLKTPYLSGRIL